MIAAFYHAYQYGAWQHIYDEQMALMEASGLMDVLDVGHIGVNGSDAITVPRAFTSMVRNPNPAMEEADTLTALAMFAATNDATILYFHTKGVTQPTSTVDDWRDLMNYFCLERWRDCIDMLAQTDADAVGTDFSDDHCYGQDPHFSGNFWWTTSEHIRNLDPAFLTSGFRFHREFWIGTAGTLRSIHDAGLDHYHYPYQPHEYRDKETAWPIG